MDRHKQMREAQKKLREQRKKEGLKRIETWIPAKNFEEAKRLLEELKNES